MPDVDGIRKRRFDGGRIVSRDADGPGLTRREALSVSGAAALAGLAGCGGRLSGRFTGGGPATIDAAALTDATRGDVPSVPETIPVDVESAFVDDQVAVAQSHLDSVPAPFDAEEIPNGVIRERLNDDYDHALRSMRDVSGAPTPYERLEHATDARTSARGVQAGWRAIESALTAGDLRESISAVDDDVDAFESRRSYVGADPVRATVVHAELERRVRGARNWSAVRNDDLDRANGRALELADIAVDVERARADVAVGSYLLDRFRASLDSPVDRRDLLATAHAELRDRVGTRAEPLPAERVDDPSSLVDRDIETTTGVLALASLSSDARPVIGDARAEDPERRLASRIVAATRALTYLRAFGTLRDRIEGGDDVAIESAADVAELRDDAVAAAEAARDSDRGALLVDALLPRFAREISWTDDRFDRGSGSVRVDLASRSAADYVAVAELCRALPPVSAEVTGVLRGSA